MRSVFSIVLALGSLSWGVAQAQPAAPPAAAPAAPAPAPTTPAPAAEPAAPPASEPAPAPASEPAPAPGPATSEPVPPPVAPSFPVPKYEKPPVPTEWDQPTFPPPEASRSRRTTEAGFELNVPIWFTPDDGAVDPGFGFAGRFGLLVGKYFVPEVNLGWQINWLDDDVVGINGLSMDTFWFSLGARVRFDNDGLVTPFVSGAFDMNFVHREGDEDYVCGGGGYYYYYYSCGTVANYEFAPGFSGKVGVAFELSKYTAIDVGARIAMLFAADVFRHAEGYVSPFVGITFYN